MHILVYTSGPEKIKHIVQMIPYKSIITLDKTEKRALYLQLSSQIISLIKAGTLCTKTRLPSTRNMAETLGIHRKTVVAAYEDLLVQGWLESKYKKGTYVNTKLPILKKTNEINQNTKKETTKTGFNFYKEIQAKPKIIVKKEGYQYINDGVGDNRLTPLKEIGILYKNIAAKKNTVKEIGYSSTYGNQELRQTLCTYLNETRGLNIEKENILITRGSQMGISLSAKLLLQPEDKIAIGTTNYISADNTFKLQKANLIRINVDAHGIQTKDLEKKCKLHNIKAVYVTPHHHHPTTVTLCAERRLHLLNLAKEYNFAIIEDDYDYDFHYSYSPILPLASHDNNGNVIYIGSICKTVAPVFRIGYLIGPTDFVNEAAKIRTYIDRQGDALLELTFSNFIKNGDLNRHINKTIKIYKKRRDLFCELLDLELSEFLTFEKPKGGMAVWVGLNKKYNWDAVSSIAETEKLIISDWRRYDMANTKHNHIRMGFAYFNEAELKTLIIKLKNTFEKLKKANKGQQ